MRCNNARTWAGGAFDSTRKTYLDSISNSYGSIGAARVKSGHLTSSRRSPLGHRLSVNPTHSIIYVYTNHEMSDRQSRP